MLYYVVIAYYIRKLGARACKLAVPLVLRRGNGELPVLRAGGSPEYIMLI